MSDVCNGCKPVLREILAFKYKLSDLFTFPNLLNETLGRLSISPETLEKTRSREEDHFFSCIP